MYPNPNSHQTFNIENIAVAYLRVSDTRQNLQTQKIKAIKYANKNNLILTNDMIFQEKKPASTTVSTPVVSDLSVVFKHRPELLKILIMASRKQFSHLIVYSSDRLARDVFQNALIKQHLEKNNVKIHFTKEGENFKSDPLSQKLQNILACYAEFEAATISSRVFDSLTQVFKRGDWTGGKAPIGYKIIDSPTGRALDIDKSKIDIIKTTFDLYSKGYGYRSIAQELSKNYFPYSFKKSTIEYMLQNEVYFGTLTWGKKGGRRKNHLKKETYLSSDYKENLDVIETNTKRIVNLLRSVKPTIKDPQYFSSPFILKDLLICSKCGMKLLPKNYGKNKPSVYRCPTKENLKSHNIVKSKIIEDLVLEKLLNPTYSENDITKGYNHYLKEFYKKNETNNDIITETTNKILKLKENIKNIDYMLKQNPQEHIEKGLLKYKHHFEDYITLFSKQLNNHKNKLNIVPISFNEFCNEIKNIKFSITDKRILCFILINKIIVSNENNQLKLDIIISPKTL
ncbi:hypothetical protein Z968_06525 [Clostridium novyi A str. 4552]|uniref:Uncharacterized protein n=1 Tax=Clostridium novyi A str. 4552 TaxID=1444289 RepID=A0A0A0I9S0_CLONO|nr:recombinase family protein [Clostridium novyi]KGM96370.1 hypothetical protein Z968_06525 [Clostridium novyi A str. 4552]